MLFRKNIIKFVIIVATLGLLIFFNTLRVKLNDFILATSKPFLVFPHKVQDFLGWSWGALSKDEILQVLADNEKLRVSKFEYDRLEQEVISLKRILGFGDEKKIILRGARVLFHSYDLGKEFLIIDQGSEAFIARGSPVLDAYGVLVGFVNDVYGKSAKVEVASSPGVSFEAEVIPSKIRSLATGMGGLTLSLDLIPAGVVMRKGDFLVAIHKTTHSINNYLVGRVGLIKDKNAPFLEARASLLVRPEFLREVFVVVSTRL